jgi:protein O-mannosyl-transferase
MVPQGNKQIVTTYAPLFIILAAVFLFYSNTFNAAWHFDDFDNIHTNQALHLADLEAGSLFNTFFANPTFPNKQILYRPVSNLTLALNWYWGGENVWGYHLFNIVIHFLAAVFLFLTICCLYSTPTLADTNRKQTCNIAFFATLLWALNPIQTQAVTYIIQRMASLAAMFYIIAIYQYLKARQTPLTRNKILLFSGTFFCGLLAMGSKENAVTLPACLVLIEIFFFKTFHSWNNKKKIQVSFTCIALLCAATLVLTHGDPLSFVNGYASRSFTLAERLLTEPRIIIIYLSQLIYPATFRLSLEHDITLSKSLLEPWTTLPSILFLLFLIYYSIVLYRKRPIVSFSIIFFFLNNLVESTALPLELIFEHRNYLPSMFFFVPFLDYFLKNGPHSVEKSSAYPWLRIIFLSTLAILFGTGTYIRNLDWKSEKSLWQDTLEKAPKSARAAYNLGNWYLEAGQYDEAISLFSKAEHHAGTAPTPQFIEVLALNGKGSVQLFTGNAKEASLTFEKALVTDPLHSASRANLALAFIALKNWKDAELHIRKVLEKEPNNIDYNYMHNIISLASGQTGPLAHIFIRDFLPKKPKSANLILLTSIIYKMMGQYKEAEIYANRYLQLFNHDIPTMISLIELYIAMNNNTEKCSVINELRSKATSLQIRRAYYNNSLLGYPVFSKETIIQNFPEIKIPVNKYE